MQNNIILKESLEIINTSLMDNIGAEEISSYNIIKFDISDYNLEELIKDDLFIQALRKAGLKNDDIEYMSDYQTYINRNYKFMLIRELNTPEIEMPSFIISQLYDDIQQKWDSPRMYEINGNFNIFYDKLTSRTIQITNDNKEYVYHTDNGNEWNLITGEPNDIFPSYIRTNAFMTLIQSNLYQIDII